MDDSQERPSAPQLQRDWPALLALLVTTLVLRGGVLLVMPEGLEDDPDGYRRIAENVLRTGVYSFDRRDRMFAYRSSPIPTAYRPPLYPLVLTKVAREIDVTPVGVGLLHLGLGVATVWGTWLLGRQWKLGHWSLVAGLLVACDPILLNQSTQVMTETLATFLAVVALFALTRLSQQPTPWNAALAGGAIALGVLCRPTFLPWLALAALITPILSLATGRKTTYALRLMNVAAFVAIAAGVLSLWAVRNYQVFGRPIVTTTHGGYTLALGNNPSFYQHLREGKWGTTWGAAGLSQDIRAAARAAVPPGQVRSNEERELDEEQAAYELAMAAIRAEPFTFLYACVYRVGQLWSPLPHGVQGDEASPVRLVLAFPVAFWYLVVYVLAIGGGCAVGRSVLRTPWLWGLLLCLTFTAVHTLYWSNLRMRAPLVPFVCLLAAVGIGHVVHYLRRRK